MRILFSPQRIDEGTGAIITSKRKPEYSEINLYQCHLVHQKPHAVNDKARVVNQLTVIHKYRQI
jgi:hypothetical protein